VQVEVGLMKIHSVTRIFIAEDVYPFFHGLKLRGDKGTVLSKI